MKLDLFDIALAALEMNVAAAQGVAAEAYALTCDARLGLDAVDHEVVRSQLGAATFILSNLLGVVLDEADTACDPTAVAAAAKRRRPRIRPRGRDQRRYVAALAAAARRNAERARKLWARLDRQPGSRIIANLAETVLRLDVVEAVLGDPRRRDGLDATLEACRDAVRRRINHGDAPSK